VTNDVETAVAPARAYASGPAQQAVRALVDTLTEGLRGAAATAVLYFSSSGYDPTDLAGPIAAAFPEAAVIGCSTAGEFTDVVSGHGGISAVALPYGILTGAVAELADLSGNVADGASSMVARLEQVLRVRLRDLDPGRHFGVLLTDGLHGAEELVLEQLGNAAPLLDVVGGSAGDDLNFRHTWVAVGDRISYQGAALLICQTGVPFRVLKTCSLVPTERVLRVTEADPDRRIVLSFNGRPAIEAYAAAIGVPVAQVDTRTWLNHPVCVMIEGEPWVRSPHSVTAEGGLGFHAQLFPGSQVHVMTGIDLIADTARAIDAARTALGGHASGAVVFNSVLRRLEIEATNAEQAFLDAFGGVPTAGFHTYGEAWIGLVNQSLTGIVLG